MSRRKILFVDRDGTLIEEPADFQIDSYEKFRLVEGVIPAMLRLRDAGYEFVMVTNQDGLGLPQYPEEGFDKIQALLLQVFESQGLSFAGIHIDRSFAKDNLPTRKPGIGMVLEYLTRGDLDLDASAMVGDRDTDLEFARNLGIRGFKLAPGPDRWPEIAHALVDRPRRAKVERITKETRIRVDVDLDREAAAEVATGIGFFDHMLEQIGRHGGFALTLTCAGDTHIDEHHTVEDSAIALGQALRQALGDKRGIARYGYLLPMDEARVEVALDLSGRAWLEFDGEFKRERVGDLPTELVSHFFHSFADALGANLHVRVSGENTHHMIEACFKGVARALRQAIRRDGTDLPSTKGVLA